MEIKPLEYNWYPITREEYEAAVGFTAPEGGRFERADFEPEESDDGI